MVSGLVLLCALLAVRTPAVAAQEPVVSRDVRWTPNATEATLVTLGASARPEPSAGGLPGSSTSPPTYPETRVLAPAAVGSGAGLVGGFLFGAGPFYDVTGCCGGGDDPGLSSALLFAATGSAIAAAGGAVLGGTPERPVTFGGALSGAAVGIFPGMLFGAVGGAAFDLPGFVVGYALGQGLITATTVARR